MSKINATIVHLSKKCTECDYQRFIVYSVDEPNTPQDIAISRKRAQGQFSSHNHKTRFSYELQPHQVINV